MRNVKIVLVILMMSVFMQSICYGLEFEKRREVNMEILYNRGDLGEKIKTTPVHPEDENWISAKETSAGVNDKSNFGISVRSSCSYGLERLRLTGGLSARLNTLHFKDKYREGMYSTRRHDKNKQSFVFTQLRPSFYTLNPSIGIESEIKSTVLGFNVGFPYMGWRVKSGHDRYGKWETVQRDSWRGFGRSYSGFIGYNYEPEAILFVNLILEEYNPQFKGERAKIRSKGITIGFQKNF